MTGQSEQREAQPHEQEDELIPAASPLTQLNIDDLGGVTLAVTAELGCKSVLVREVLDLRQGSVVTLDKQAGEMADIHVSGIPFAKGEVVVLGDVLHVRIAEVLGVADKETETDA